MIKDYEDLKVGDILYREHRNYPMKGWWLLKPSNSKTPSFLAQLIHQEIPEGIDDEWLSYRITSATYSSFHYVGTKNDFPEYFL